MSRPTHSLDALVGEDDEPPLKRPRMIDSMFKRPRLSGDSPNPPPSSVPVGQVLESSPLWYEAFKMANNIAPRVGNVICDDHLEFCEMVQQLVGGSLRVRCIFVCRGTDRFQVPMAVPPSNEVPLRQTLCMRRQEGTIHDFGIQDWHRMTRANRIANNMPSKLTISIFGTSENNPSAEGSIRPNVNLDAN